MFKTIFSKLLVLFIAIIVISFSIAGVVLFYLLDNFVYSEKENLLVQSADDINKALDSYIQNRNDSVAELFARKALNQLMEAYSAYTSSYIWVVDPQGNIVFAKPDIMGRDFPENLRNKLIDQNGMFRLPDERQYRKVMMSGQNVMEKGGDFYGLFENVSVLNIQKPYKYTESRTAKETVGAAVYLTTPMPEVHKLQWTILRFFIMSISVSVLIAILIAYFFSNRLSKPLKEINNAARIIANGEFQKRLNIKSKDEVGELANSFNHMVVALQNLEEMRRGFIANVSHELRTPMTSIRGFIEGILDGTIPTEKQSSYLTIVRDEVNRLNRLVNNLLDLARMEAGEVNMKFINFNIHELIRRSIIKMESLILQKDLEIEAVFETEDIYVFADIDAIERVILNLFHNAIKFTPEGGRIVISTASYKDKVAISVQDSGIGIGEEEKRLIWDRFYKSDKSRSQDKSGTGLGLAIVKSIISEHKQDIWVDSELGKGAKFSFTLTKSNNNEAES